MFNSLSQKLEGFVHNPKSYECTLGGYGWIKSLMKNSELTKIDDVHVLDP